MRLLINKEDVSKYVKVSFYRKEDDFTRWIQEAQMFDLKGLCCEAFYQDLVSDTPQRDYALLLSGGQYEWKGAKYEFAGLKAALSYFAFAHYVFMGHQSDTPWGVKEKMYQDSDKISQMERRDARTIYMQRADTLWQDCKKYVERNKERFPEWGACDSGCDGGEKVGRFRMRLF